MDAIKKRFTEDEFLFNFDGYDYYFKPAGTYVGLYKRDDSPSKKRQPKRLTINIFVQELKAYLFQRKTIEVENIQKRVQEISEDLKFLSEM